MTAGDESWLDNSTSVLCQANPSPPVPEVVQNILEFEIPLMNIQISTTGKVGKLTVCCLAFAGYELTAPAMYASMDTNVPLYQ